jgi:uncharacterized protein (DUF1330 family)/catechol 2,3-dioxygenase-like lactoylglutathione lyase family enzyme
MAGYFIANYAITNQAGYDEYIAAVGPTLDAHGAERVVIDRGSVLLEGPAGQVSIVLRFASKRAVSRHGCSRGAPHTVGMPVRLHHIVIDARDLPALARFWTQALGWEILSQRPNEIVIGTDENAPVGMCFMPVTEAKASKNRLHLDLTSGPEDREQEIGRLLALGARRVDIGQAGTESWTVLADPEGNEFCVVRPKETLIR